MKGRIVSGDFNKWAALSFGLLKGAVIVVGAFNKVDLAEKLNKVEIVTEENKKSIISATGWGILGGITFGPLGALTGLVFGGRRKEHYVACYLNDGRKFLAVVDSEALLRLQSLCF
jgi:proteasome assembly chaperone (PAC2) family protein